MGLLSHACHKTAEQQRVLILFFCVLCIHAMSDEFGILFAVFVSVFCRILQLAALMSERD